MGRYFYTISPDAQATVTRLEPMTYSSPGTWNYGQPVCGHTIVDGKYVTGPQKMIVHLSCGHTMVTQDAKGTVVTCEDCQEGLAKIERLRADHAAGRVSYSRAAANGYGSPNGQIYLYRYDSTSPSGRFSLGYSVPDCAQVAAILTGSCSPLSPTEPV